MISSKSPAAPVIVAQQLKVVRRRLERWRRTRKHRSPIPEALWSASVAVACAVGLTATARALRLDYNSLKKRLEISSSRDSSGCVTSPRFIELVAPPVPPAGECMVEIEHPGGTRIRLHFTGGAMPELGALSRAFWSVGS